jgi:hypothetical protein
MLSGFLSKRITLNFLLRRNIYKIKSVVKGHINFFQEIIMKITSAYSALFESTYKILTDAGKEIQVSDEDIREFKRNRTPTADVEYDRRMTLKALEDIFENIEADVDEYGMRGMDLKGGITVGNSIIPRLAYSAAINYDFMKHFAVYALDQVKDREVLVDIAKKCQVISIICGIAGEAVKLNRSHISPDEFKRLYEMINKPSTDLSAFMEKTIQWIQNR